MLGLLGAGEWWCTSCWSGAKTRLGTLVSLGFARLRPNAGVQSAAERAPPHVEMEVIMVRRAVWSGLSTVAKRLQADRGSSRERRAPHWSPLRRRSRSIVTPPVRQLKPDTSTALASRARTCAVTDAAVADDAPARNRCHRSRP